MFGIDFHANTVNRALISFVRLKFTGSPPHLSDGRQLSAAFRSMGFQPMFAVLRSNQQKRSALTFLSPAPPCIGPPDARVALLPSPVLPAAEVVVATKKPGVHRPTIHAAEEPDILTLEKHRTFLLWLDKSGNALEIGGNSRYTTELSTARLWAHRNAGWRVRVLPFERRVSFWRLCLDHRHESKRPAVRD